MSDIAIGVLGLQGDVDEHLSALARAKANGVRVKTPEDLARVDGLIIPGGESTTVGAMLERFGLAEPIKERAKRGMPIWGTCMGMIVMAGKIAGAQQPALGLLDIEVKRNAFGRQIESAEVPLEITGFNGKPFPGVFIRAPWIERTWGDAKILARLEDHGVMVRQGNRLGTSFHPELTDDLRLHRYFLGMVTPAGRGR
jgi:5'-phosphate synthase pdxT subunit